MGYMDQIISQVGEDITLTKVTGSTVSDWGDTSSETTEEVKLHAHVNLIRAESEYVEEGDFEEGDIQLFLDTRWSDDVDQGYRLTYNGRDYEITRVETQRLDHSNKHIEVRAKPV